MQISKRIMNYNPRVDYDIKLLLTVLFLTALGIVMIYSASSALAFKKYANDYYFVKRQALHALSGIVLLLGCAWAPPKIWRVLAYPLLLITLVFLLLTDFTSLGVAAGGARRWFHIWGFTFQPSELLRFTFIIYLSYSLCRKKERLKEFSVGFLPHVLVLIFFAGLILRQPDFGSVVILCLLTWTMMFAAGVRLGFLLSAFIIILPMVGYIMINEGYRVERLITFWNPWQYANQGGYQIVHSLMAFGAGGMWGAGIGQGVQKLFYLPEPHTDFIFSVIGEELGLAGVIFILTLYIVILYKGLRIAMNASDMFTSLLAGGLVTAMFMQVCVNMGVTLALLPTKGLTLPFLSYGGTSLNLNMASIGILMSIGRTTTTQSY